MSELNRLKKALGGSGKINESEFPKNIFLKDYLKPEIYGNASDHAKDAEKHKSDYIHKSENPKFGPNHEDTIKSKALWKWHTAQKHYHEGKPNSQSWYSSNMEDFEKLRRSHALLVNKKEKNIDETCWKDYTQVGMKMKNGKKVPNCVPAEGVPKQVKEDSIEEVLDTPEAKSSYIMKASDKNVKDAVSSAKDIFSSPEKFDKEQSKIKRRNKTVRKVLSKLNKEEVSESSDYFRRRQKEEDIISGKKPARKRIPKGNDYFQRRAEEEKKMNEDISDVYKNIKRVIKGKKSAGQVKQDYQKDFEIAKGVVMQFRKPKSGNIKSITKTAHANYSKASKKLNKIKKVVDKDNEIV